MYNIDLANRLVPTLVLRQLLGGKRSNPSHLMCNTVAQFIQSIVTYAGILTHAAFGQLRTILEPDLNKEKLSWEEAMRTVNVLTLEDRFGHVAVCAVIPFGKALREEMAESSLCRGTDSAMLRRSQC